MTIYKNSYIKVEIEKSQIPWLKIFTQKPYKEFSQCDKDTKDQLLTALDIIEKEMLEYFKPTKINIASFGNYLPHVHFHIMARFESDSHFPEPMWGAKQRESNLSLPDMNIFFDRIGDILKNEL
jgi:diadenosine tetraphosphate (Ap4A) HIT family hydrolase